MAKPRTRSEARAAIVQAANRHRAIRWGALLPLLSGRQLQQAVAIVRHRRLVKPEVLVLAGFNAERRAY